LQAPLKLAAEGSDVTTRLSVTLARANVLAATKHWDGAQRAARQVLAEAPKNLVALRLEASLTLAEIEIHGTNPPQGIQRLREVSRSASKKGFALIARKASGPSRQ